MRKTINLAICMALTILQSACGQDPYEKKLKLLYNKTVPLIYPEELDSMMKNNDNLILLDTRAKNEYKVSHIEGARFIDFDNFAVENVKDIPKDSEIIVYCSVGVRSEKIGETLQNEGFKRVKNLYGGIFEWKNSDFEVFSAKNEPTDSVHAYSKFWGIWLKKGVKVYD